MKSVTREYLLQDMSAASRLAIFLLLHIEPHRVLYFQMEIVNQSELNKRSYRHEHTEYVKIT